MSKEKTKIKNHNNIDICKKNKAYHQSGITLVALVVTIVILIILATISVSALFGENGLIKKAQEAREHQSNAVAMEQGEMDKLADEYANLLEEGNGGDNTGGNIDPETGWDLDKVQKVTSDDGIIVPVPIGYTKSTVPNEGSVNTGFVIKEGDNGAATEGINEFVWVPVKNISDLYDAANNAGQLWDFGTSSSGWKNPAVKRTYPTTQNSEYREPDVVTGASSGSDSTGGSSYDAVSSNLQEAGLSIATATEFKTQLQNEFTEMRNSVEKYGGFYIGRYETGNLSSETEAVVQKNNADIRNQTWYTHYKLSKTIAAGSNVKTSMIWGCQWDATLRWMQNDGVTEEVKNFPTNSEGKGNYSGTQGSKNEPIPTGSNPAYAVNNIYDMAGNVSDWTLEAELTDRRVTRGGYFYITGSTDPASSRYYSRPTSTYSDVGSRSTLYVAL